MPNNEKIVLQTREGRVKCLRYAKLFNKVNEWYMLIDMHEGVDTICPLCKQHFYNKQAVKVSPTIDNMEKFWFEILTHETFIKESMFDSKNLDAEKTRQGVNLLECEKRIKEAEKIIKLAKERLEEKKKQYDHEFKLNIEVVTEKTKHAFGGYFK